MRALALFAAVALSGCGDWSGEWSPCGAWYQVVEHARAEGAILDSFAAVGARDPVEACSMLNGYIVQHRAGDLDLEVAPWWGVTDCKAKTITLAPGMERWTLPRELAQATGHCVEANDLDQRAIDLAALKLSF